MARKKGICKICGKEYEHCISFRPNGNKFVWQDVACCPEHGSLYFARILKSRGENPADYGFDIPHEDLKEEIKEEENTDKELLVTPEKKEDKTSSKERIFIKQKKSIYNKDK